MASNTIPDNERAISLPIRYVNAFAWLDIPELSCPIDLSEAIKISVDVIAHWSKIVAAIADFNDHEWGNCRLAVHTFFETEILRARELIVEDPEAEAHVASDVLVRLIEVIHTDLSCRLAATDGCKRRVVAAVVGDGTGQAYCELEVFDIVAIPEISGWFIKVKQFISVLK